MQRPVALIASLLLVGCASTLPLGQQTASVKLVLDPELMRQYLWHTQLLTFPSAVTVELAYLDPNSAINPVKKTFSSNLTKNGVPTSIDLGSIPLGTKRVVSLFPEPSDPSRMWGFAYRAVFDLSTASTVVNLNWQTTPAGTVISRLINDKFSRINEINCVQLQHYMDSLKANQNIVHYGLIDTERVVSAIKQATGSLSDLSFLDSLTPAPVKDPLWLKLNIVGLPDGVGATVKLNDPLSPLQSDLRNGTYLVGPIWPFAKAYGGTLAWQLNATADGYDEKVESITLDPSTTPETTLDYRTWNKILPGLATPRYGMATILANSLCFFVGGVTTTATGSQLMGNIDSFNPSCKTFITYPKKADYPPGPSVAYCAIANSGSNNYLMGGITGWNNGTPTVSRTIQHLTLNNSSDETAVAAWDQNVAPNMPRARAYGGGAFIDGKVYVVGGSSATGSLIPEVDIYDPNTISDTSNDGVEAGKWSLGTNLPTPREDVGVCALNERLYVIGGDINGVPQGTVECYDPITKTWATLAPLPTPRYGIAVTTLKGKIYVIGGVRQIPYHTNILEHCKVVEVFDPTTGKWTSRSPINCARAFASAYAIEGISSSSIYVLGGENGISIAPIEWMNGSNL